MTGHFESSREESAQGEHQRVFISYRRNDCQAQANGLHDGLSHRLRTARIFMDIDSIPPGVDFEDHIRREIEVCDVVLVLVGDEWLDARPGSEVRRIDEPNDFVRLEIESALSSPQVRILPVLVEGAQMPRAEELPESIRRLARINAIELSDRRWTSDIERLASIVQSLAQEPTHVSRTRQTMRMSDIDDEAVAEAVAMMPGEFRTKDLSEHPDVLSAHGELTRLSNYHTMMGRYLAKHHEALSLQAPAPATDSRGAIWRRTAPPPPSPPQSPSQLQRVDFTTSPPAPPSVSTGTRGSDNRTPAMGWVMVALPIVSCGFASFVPPLWATAQRPQDRQFRRRMITFAAVIGAIAILGFLMLVSGPTDSEGVPTGFASDLGGVLWLTAMVVATVIAVIHRKPRTQLPGTVQELARRRMREQYRDLIKRDQSLALNINVGRPGLPREYDDGGLLDLNHVSAGELTRFGSIPPDEAQRIVETRERIGRLSSIEELGVYAGLSDSTVARLRETAVFL
jgi:hypothetical protein